MMTPPLAAVGPALVTGGSRGIGRVVAARLAALGAPVAINYLASRTEAEALVAAITTNGGRAVALQADVSKIDQATALVERAEDALGPLVTLINNAGVTRDKLLLQMSELDWDDIWCTDLAGPRALAREAVRVMGSRSHGRIVNVASVVGAVGNAGQANYAAAKSALMGFTRELALLSAARGVTVNCVVPGYIVTDATSHLTAEQREVWLSRIPLGRYALPEEVADLILFLTGSGASYITGQCITVDGGLLAASGGGLAS